MIFKIKNKIDLKLLVELKILRNSRCIVHYKLKIAIRFKNAISFFFKLNWYKLCSSLYFGLCFFLYCMKNTNFVPVENRKKISYIFSNGKQNKVIN